MLAAEIWHWWIGVVLLIVTLLIGVVLVYGYMKNVVSEEYPDAEQSHQLDL
jgi:hypothetical protein